MKKPKYKKGDWVKYPWMLSLNEIGRIIDEITFNRQSMVKVKRKDQIDYLDVNNHKELRRIYTRYKI